jgi:hypothetical protein
MKQDFAKLIEDGQRLIATVKTKKDEMGFPIYYCDTTEEEAAVFGWELRVAEKVEQYGLDCHKKALKDVHIEVHYGVDPPLALMQRLEIIKCIAELEEEKNGEN